MSLLQQLLDKITPDVKRFTRLKFDIVDAIMIHLQNNGQTQKHLAQQLGKSESEISKWLSGQHNLTLKSIAKMEAALGIDVIKVQIPKKLNHEAIPSFMSNVHAYKIKNPINLALTDKANLQPTVESSDVMPDIKLAA